MHKTQLKNDVRFLNYNVFFMYLFGITEVKQINSNRPIDSPNKQTNNFMTNRQTYRHESKPTNKKHKMNAFNRIKSQKHIKRKIAICTISSAKRNDRLG